MPIKLFVSHISEEGDIAALLKETMEKDFFGLVEFFTSSDIGSISAGEDWLSAVQRAMNEAAAVLVLCSKASVLRPWVQFELGAAWMKQVPIIPVCHSGLMVADLQMPLSLRQGIQLGTEAGLQRLYQSVAKILKFPQVPEPRDMDGFFDRISKLEERFQHGGVQQFERYIDVVIPPPGSLDSESVPEGTKIESNDVSMELFGLANATGRTWRDIAKAARKRPDTRWLSELQRCIRSASQNELFRPVQAIYHTGQASYQPQLAKKEVLPDGTSRFHVHFVETVVAPLREVDNDFGLLATLLRLGLRFRYEVVERFPKITKAAAQRYRKDAEAARQETLQQLRNSIQIIENDALSRGSENIDREAVAALFDDEHDRDAIAHQQDVWDEVRAGLFHDDPAPTMEQLEEILMQLRDMNFHFMRLATRRYYELVSARWPAKSEVIREPRAPGGVERRRALSSAPPTP